MYNIANLKSYYFSLNFLDKFLIVFICLMPLFLATSIFLADFFASLSGIILIFILLQKNSISIFKDIKKEIFYFFIFYLIILISFFFSNFKSDSFLPSIFYFRYFLLSLVVFYIFSKHEKIIHLFFLSLIATFLLIFSDSLIQLFFGKNLFGYELIGSEDQNKLNYITSFFADEKKLGSYIVRMLPLLLFAVSITLKEKSFFIELIILISCGLIVILSSERVALFLLLLIYFFYFLTSKKKTYFIIFTLLLFTITLGLNKKLKEKYIEYTINQTGIVFLLNDEQKKTKAKEMFKDNNIPRLFSNEHENLIFTGLIIFKENIFFGSGVKTFYKKCNEIKDKIYINNQRENIITCSTHPHNTYIQVLSEIGIFGFIFLMIFYLKTVFNIIKNINNKKLTYLNKSYYYINLNIIINLFPIIPSGSIFNNWLSLLIFFSFGFHIYMKKKISDEFEN